jgi:hypothetical protein
MADIPPELEAKLRYQWYDLLCSRSETERISNVKNAADALLKLRADTLLDSSRLTRVYLAKKRAHRGQWSLEQSFSATHYRKFLKSLPPKVHDQCRAVTFGDVFSNDPNGTIVATEFGPIVTISEALWHFLWFAHLGIIADRAVPYKVKLAGLRIAIRIMLRTETMDFSLDPRGIVPDRVESAVARPILPQLQFIAGHEFAHFILGHLSEASIVEKPLIYALAAGEEDSKPMRIYTKSQAQELEADIQSVLLPLYDPRQRAEIFQGALLFFACLELYQTVREVMSPSNPWAFKSHPSAMERYENLLRNITKPDGLDMSTWERLPMVVEALKAVLKQDVTLNPDVYETYGSVYLDEPNSKWRGPELIDRRDY